MPVPSELWAVYLACLQVLTGSTASVTAQVRILDLAGYGRHCRDAAVIVHRNLRSCCSGTTDIYIRMCLGRSTKTDKWSEPAASAPSLFHVAISSNVICICIIVWYDSIDIAMSQALQKSTCKRAANVWLYNTCASLLLTPTFGMLTRQDKAWSNFTSLQSVS